MNNATIKPMIQKKHLFCIFLSFSFLFLISLFLPLPVAAQAEVTSSSTESKIWIIPIQGDIEPSLTAFVRRETRKALSSGAEYLIFEIDTFGGRVDSALQITSFLLSIKNARTIAWVNNSESSMGVSWSAGALIAFSCTDIYMAPGTSMGAAAPVVASPGGEMESAGEKSIAAVRSQMAALAERNNHPVGIALAMVDYDVELWEATVNGQTSAITLAELERLEKESGGSVIERVGIICPAGKLLSLTAGEATRYGLAAGLAGSREDLLETIGITGEITESSPSAADAIITLLTSGPVQAILIILGIVMIFLEIQSPGFGIPGITAIIAFLVVFGSSALLGRVGSLEIIMLLAGIGLLAVEIFVIPGFGVVGISGFILIGLSLVLSMQDFVIPRFDWEWPLFGRNLLVVFAGLMASITGIAIIALLGPKLHVFDRLTLKAQITDTANPSIEDEENLENLVGKTGTADSTLRPSGKAVIDGNIYAVEADNEFIDEGKSIVVTRVRGNRIIVRRV